MKKRIVTVAVLGIIMMVGCEKDTTVIIPKNPEAAKISRTVSFSKDLVPIFKSDCALSGCHVTGGHAPDLEAEDAYSSLMKGNFINKAAPESSIIYERLTGKLTPGMPMKAPGSDPLQIEELFLAWASQGALNN